MRELLSLADDFLEFEDGDEGVGHAGLDLAVYLFVAFAVEVVFETEDGAVEEGLETDAVADQVEQVAQVLEVLDDDVVVLLGGGCFVEGRPELEGLDGELLRIVLQLLQQRLRNDEFVVGDAAHEHPRPQRLRVPLDELAALLLLLRGLQTLQGLHARRHLQHQVRHHVEPAVPEGPEAVDDVLAGCGLSYIVGKWKEESARCSSR